MGGAFLQVGVDLPEGQQLDNADRQPGMHDVEGLQPAEVLGRQQTDHIAEEQETRDAVVHVGDRVLVLEPGDFLVQGADDEVLDLVTLVGHEVLGVVAEHHVALDVAGGFREDGQLVDGLQARVQGQLRQLLVSGPVVPDLGQHLAGQGRGVVQGLLHGGCLGTFIILYLFPGSILAK